MECALGNNYYSREWPSNLACIPRVSDSGFSGVGCKTCICDKLPYDIHAPGVWTTF